MTAERILLDSVILIDLLNGVPAARQWLATMQEAGCVSAITRAEVLAGVTDAETVSDVRALLDGYSWLAIDPEVADLAAELRYRHRWKLPDALQAAVALHHGVLLATRNTRDFPPQVHPFVRVPYAAP